MTSAPRAQERARPHRRVVVVLLEVLAAVVVVALLQALVVKPFGVPSRSMEQTLRIGDRILVSRADTSLQRADVVVFSHGATWEQRRLPPASSPFGRAARTFGDLTGLGPSSTAYTVKRVIGLPGETVQCCSTDGRVVVDGAALDEPYVDDDLPYESGRLDCTSSPRSLRCFPAVRVTDGFLLLLGDHRSRSADSVVGCRGSVTGPECARLVSTDRVVGPVLMRFWPPSRVGPVRR